MKKRIHNPKTKNGIQKPGKLTGFITKIIIFIDVIFFIMFILGIMSKETDITLVSGGVALFILALIFFLKRAYDITYQENNEYFIVSSGKTSHQIRFADIINWKSTYNEISVLDKNQTDGKFVRINMVLFKPEILLRKIADMTFDGKFKREKETFVEDPNRELEIVNYLTNMKYGYLIKDYIEKVDTDTQYYNK